MAIPTVAQVGVRIRSTGGAEFKSETENTVKSSFSGLAKIAGLAFGGAAIGQIIKGSIESAAQTAAQGRVIQETFGKAGNALIDFANKGGIALGSLSGNTEQAAIQFGELFKNAGASSQQASAMAEGWTKFGLAVNNVRGGGPGGAEEVLQELTRAAAGTSTRGLTQLGISLSATSIQAQAVHDHFIALGQSASALTPLQKQTAIYQLVLQKLPTYLAEAKANSGDLINVQARLTAEWGQAKNALGTALLPEVTKLTTELANWLQKMEQSGRLQHDFNQAARVAGEGLHYLLEIGQSAVHVWDGFSHAVGGAKNALILLGGAFALVKAHSFGGAIKGDAEGIAARIKAQVAGVKQAADQERNAGAGATAAWGKAHDAITKSAEATKKSVVSTASAASGAWAKAHNDIAKSVSSATTAATSGVATAGTQAVRRVSVAGSDAAGAVMEAEAEMKAATQAATKTTVESVTARGAAYDKYATQVQADAARVKTATTAASSNAVRDEEWYRKNIPSYVPGSLEKGRKKIQEDLQRSLKQPGGPPIRPLPPAIKTGLAGEEYGFQHFFTAQEQGWGKVQEKAKSATGAISKANTATANQVTRAWGSTTTKIKSGLDGVKTGVQKASSSFAGVGTAATKVGTQVKTSASSMKSSLDGVKTSAASASSAIGSGISNAATTAKTSFGAAAVSMKIAAREVGATILSSIVQTGIGLLVVAIGIAVSYILTHWDTVKKYTIALGLTIKAVFFDVLKAIEGYYEAFGGVILTTLTAPIRAFLEIVYNIVKHLPTSIFGISTGVGAIKTGLGDAIGFLKQGTTDLVTKGAKNLASGVTNIFGDAKNAWNKALADSGNDPASQDAAKKGGRHVMKNLLDGATSAVAGVSPALTKTLSNTLLNAVQAAQKAIQTSVQDAKNNLDKIGQDLAKTIDQIQQKIGGAAGAIAGSPQGQAFAKLKKLLESGAPSFEISRTANELQNQLKDVGKTQQTQVQSQLANLTAAFNQGKIGYKEFLARLHEILTKDGVTLKEALKAGGPAFADTFKAQVRALREQAKAISVVPARFRGIGGAGGAADIKIIQPLQTIRDQQNKIAAVASKIAAEAAKQRAAILKQQQQTAQNTQAIKEGLLPKKVSAATKTVQEPLNRGQRTFLDALEAHRRAGVDAAGRARARPPEPRVRIPPQGPTATPRQRIIAQGSAQDTRTATKLDQINTTTTGVKGEVRGAHVALLGGLREVCADVIQAGKDIVAAELQIVKPLDNLRQTERQIAERAHNQRERQLRETRTTNTLLREIHRGNGRQPGFNKEPHGKGSHDARKSNRAGVRS